jgi:hypothetical protein
MVKSGNQRFSETNIKKPANHLFKKAPFCDDSSSCLSGAHGASDFNLWRLISSVGKQFISATLLPRNRLVFIGLINAAQHRCAAFVCGTRLRALTVARMTPIRTSVIRRRVIRLFVLRRLGVAVLRALYQDETRIDLRKTSDHKPLPCLWLRSQPHVRNHNVTQQMEKQIAFI